MTTQPTSSEDLIVWSDGTVCYRYELPMMTHKSDDYEQVAEGTPRWLELTSEDA